MMIYATCEFVPYAFEIRYDYHELALLDVDRPEAASAAADKRTASFDYYAAWSPDGQRIAYHPGSAQRGVRSKSLQTQP